MKPYRMFKGICPKGHLDQELVGLHIEKKEFTRKCRSCLWAHREDRNEGVNYWGARLKRVPDVTLKEAE